MNQIINNWKLIKERFWRTFDFVLKKMKFQKLFFLPYWAVVISQPLSILQKQLIIARLPKFIFDDSKRASLVNGLLLLLLVSLLFLLLWLAFSFTDYLSSTYVLLCFKNVCEIIKSPSIKLLCLSITKTMKTVTTIKKTTTLTVLTDDDRILIKSHVVN